MSEDKQKPKKISGMSTPQPMVMNGNLAQQWKRWVQSFKFYLRASGMDEESDSRKVALFLHVIGEKGVDVFNTFGKNEDTVKYDELIQLFQDHFAPKANITYECHNFFTYRQGENETLDDFVCTLKLRSQNCELGQLQERLVKVMFICNMHQKYNYIREKLLLEDKLDLDKALEMAKAMLASRHQTDELAAEQSSVLYNKSQSHSVSQYGQKLTNKACTRCGQMHRYKCPASNVNCNKCGKVGHFAVCCRSIKSKSVKYVQSDSDVQQVQGEQDELFIGHIQSSTSLNDWKITLYIKNSLINCIIDTGSDVNIMSKSVFDSLNIKNEMTKANVKIKSYTGNTLEVLGQQNLQCKFQFNNSYVTKQINFIIANVNSPTIIGKITCSEIGLIKRVFCVETSNSQNNHSKSNVSQSQSFPLQSSQSQNVNLNKLIECNNSVFTGLGCLPGECHISTNPEIQPRVDAPRKVPFALHNRLQQELEKMEKMDVITKVTEPTAWEMTARLAFAVISSACWSAFQHGYNTGVLNAPQNVMSEWLQEDVFNGSAWNSTRGAENDPKTTTVWSIVVSIYCVGGMLGGVITGVVADRFGRKSGLLLNNILVFLGAALEAGARYVNSSEMLILGRFLIGINNGLNAGLAPMYLAEISPVSLRGSIGTVYQLVITMSILLSQVLGLKAILGTETGWPILLAITIVPALVQCCTLPLCPESPKFLLLNRGAELKAQRALTWLRGDVSVQGEMEEMHQEAEKGKVSKKVTLRELFGNRSLRQPLIIAMTVMAAQQLSGINATMFFSTDIFTQAGLDEAQSQYATLGMGTVNVVMTVISLLLVERAGRKTLLLAGFGGMLLTTIGLIVANSYTHVWWVPFVCVALVLLFVVMFAVGPGSIPWFLVNELFNQAARPAAAATAVTVNWTANFLVGLSFLPLTRVLGMYTFCIFAALQAIFILFILKKVPETKNKTVDEITAMFRQNL